MDFKYEFENIGGFLKILIEPNEKITGYIHNIRGWLSSDIQGSGDYHLPIFEKVLNGEIEKEIFSGNSYEVIIKKDFSTISYDFEDCNPTMIPCTLPTQMLYEILQIWVAKQKELRENEE